ncbi:Vacuolar protein sorting-associated protein 36 [Rhynchospora pubera]|uniref:Vacuolar protein-sorting-associated protein 36 n=1 Tax=Rhynchospora pubera TaxID=906938 RepID=A0AAV8AS51_9POAL|nr:Vacuolar protein sorting-associated protein 36 [Rhynchospora pubera]KAJ4750985.1 Vacuolar protein sorting-associated protein 36 [Rhynchospora pubera]
MTSIPRLPTASLTTSCRPVFFSGEVERYLLPGVDLESDGSDRPTLLLPFQSSLLVLTSHRLVFVDEASSSAREIALSAIIHAFPLKKSMSIRSMFASPRVRLQVSISNDGTISEKGTKSSVITLVMRGKNTDPDVFYGKFMEVLRSREWELTASANQGSTGLEGSSSASGVNDLRITMPVVGVSGILRKEQEIWESTDKNLQDAFQDLNALMSKAKEMVQLAEKMRQKLLTTGSNSQGSSNDEEMGSKQDMQDWLLSVGIASPVTKETAGALYHQQLSRQLADFVKTPLEKAGGMITLVDVYCLFNRARGTVDITRGPFASMCFVGEI